MSTRPHRPTKKENQVRHPTVLRFYLVGDADGHQLDAGVTRHFRLRLRLVAVRVRPAVGQHDADVRHAGAHAVVGREQRLAQHPDALGDVGAQAAELHPRDRRWQRGARRVLVQPELHLATNARNTDYTRTRPPTGWRAHASRTRSAGTQPGD